MLIFDLNTQVWVSLHSEISTPPTHVYPQIKLAHGRLAMYE